MALYPLEMGLVLLLKNELISDMVKSMSVPQDLTVCDPYYILPITAGCLTFLTLELGTETGQSLAQSAGNMKNYMRVAAFAVIPITVVAGFPNAVLIYWVTQASVSLVQSVFFRYFPALSSLPPSFSLSFPPSFLSSFPPSPPPCTSLA